MASEENNPKTSDNTTGAEIPPMPQNNSTPEPQTSGPEKSHRKLLLAILIPIVVIVLGLVSYFAYTHSHPYSESKYNASLNELQNAKSELSKAIKNAQKDAGKITESQVTDAKLLKTLAGQLTTAQKLSKNGGAVIKDPHSADTGKLSASTTTNHSHAEKMVDAALALTQQTTKVVTSKREASKILSPVDTAVAAAEKQKNANDKEIASKSIDVKKIAAGDYSSLDGKWVNSAGTSMTIQDGKLTPSSPIAGTHTPYGLRECSKPTDECSSKLTTATQHQLVQDGAFIDQHGNSPNTQYNLLTVQKNAKLYNAATSAPITGDDPTDSTRDRIIPLDTTFSQGQMPLCLSESCAYYRDSGSAQASAASVKKLNTAVDTAQSKINALKKPWEKSAKNSFQCRLDKVKGKQVNCDVSAKSTQSDGTANTSQLLKGDFTSIAGKWCNKQGDCIAIPKDGSYTPILEKNNGKLKVGSTGWLTSKVGSTGVFELVDTAGVQCIVAGATGQNCPDEASMIWPTDLIYYPKGVLPCPNKDICDAFGAGAQDSSSKPDTSRPYLGTMGSHMNDAPTADTAYYLQGNATAKTTKMDVKAIAKGDCSSISGTWSASEGAAYTYSDKCPSNTYIDGSGNSTNGHSQFSKER